MNTDGAGDSHAIPRGVWYAHVGWLFRRRDASADPTKWLIHVLGHARLAKVATAIERARRPTATPARQR